MLYILYAILGILLLVGLSIVKNFFIAMKVFLIAAFVVFLLNILFGSNRKKDTDDGE